MTRKPVTVRPDQTLAAARALLVKNRVRQLPVMRRRQVVGIVTDRDLRGAAAGARHVEDVMTFTPHVVSPADTADQVARVLRARKVNALPVVDDGKLVGVVSTTDVLDAFISISGIAEPSYHILVKTPAGKGVAARLRAIVAARRGEIKWLYVGRGRAREAHMRVVCQNVDDLVTSLEAEGFEVVRVVSSLEP
jgi:acetoin utilization protein AcuB